MEERSTVRREEHRCGRLDGVRAVSFDLVGTLIELDRSRLPRLVCGEVEVPSILPLVLAEARVLRPEITVEQLVIAMISAEREQETRARRERREAQAVEVFAAAIGRLDLVPPPEIEALSRRLTEIRARALIEAARPIGGAAEVLERARTLGLGLALISNFDDASAVPRILARNGMAEAFDVLVISSEVGSRKPESPMFQRALAHFELPPESVLHVGDDAIDDVWGAGRLGIRTVWLRRDGGTPPTTLAAPDLTVTRLSDLLLQLG